MRDKLENLGSNIIQFKDYYPTENRNIRVIDPKEMVQNHKPSKQGSLKHQRYLGTIMFYRGNTYYNGVCLKFDN